MKYLPADVDLATFEAIPEPSIQRAVDQLRAGALYRYCGARPEDSEVALLERDWARYVGARYAVAVNSCGSGLYIALRALGVAPGDSVLMSAFTYTAVPSAIVHAGATPVLVECGRDYCVDLEDLRRKIVCGARVLLVSHMRGHIGKMDAVALLCHENGVDLLEDCAHSLGGYYNGKHTGLFGKAGSFSTQSHKMVNSGEGGVLVTDDEELYAKAVLYSGSQEQFWKKHFFTASCFAENQESIPNLSMRMSNLAAAVLRPQLGSIEERIALFEEKYTALAEVLSTSKHVYIPPKPPEARRGLDTIQFTLPNFDTSQISGLTRRLKARGLAIDVFGRPGSPRFFRSWKYIADIETIQLPTTEAVLARTYDVRLPMALTLDQTVTIGLVVINAINDVAASHEVAYAVQ